MTGGPSAVVLRALGLGDFLTGLPALRALRRSLPGHRIVLCAPSVLEPLAACSGAVDAVSPSRPLQPLDPALGGADLAVNLHGRGPQSHRLLLALGPRRLVAFRHAAVDGTAGQPAWREREHEVVRWCRLLEANGIPADPADLHLRVPPGPLPEGAIGATLVHAGAASVSRRWPVERWAAVVRSELSRGRRVLLTGGPDEVAVARRVTELAGMEPSRCLAGTTSLLGLTRLVDVAGRVVVGDTGVAHLATALGTPSVVLFGPTSPHQWGPPPHRAEHQVLWSGRRGDPHGHVPDPGLLDLQPGDVLRALARLDRLPDRPPAAPAG